MTIYAYEVSHGLVAFLAVVTAVANLLSMRLGNAVAVVSYALVAGTGLVTSAFAALFGYWLITGIGAAAVLVGALLSIAVAHTVDTTIKPTPETAVQTEQEGTIA